MRRDTKAAALAALALLCAATSAHARHPAPGQVDIRIVVPQVLRVLLVKQMQDFEVEAADIARGYIERDKATVITVASNSRRGYRIMPLYAVALVKRVVLRLQEGEFELANGEHADIPDCRCSEQALEIGYRLYLADGMQPGRYPWPLALRFEPQAEAIPGMPFP